MTYVRRKIDVQFQLGEGDFGETSLDQINLSGHRISATITRGGGAFMGDLNMRIYGMSLDVMNRLTILGKPLTEARRNSVIVSAGDEDKGVSVAFIGTITECWIDARAAPEVALIVVAHAGYVAAMKPAPVTTYDGTVDAATVVAGLAAQMSPEGAESGDGAKATGMIFENNGVNVQFESSYLHGTLLDQLEQAARAGPFNYTIDRDTVAIWPIGGMRRGVGGFEGAPLISAATGMVGYPTYTQNGINLVTEYNPSIVFSAPVLVDSIFTPANGVWIPFSVVHDLESELPGGRWFTSLECNLVGQQSISS